VPGAGEWLKRLPEACDSLLGRPGAGEPITVLLGAGASLSSGCPSTREVAEAIMQRNPAKFPTLKSVYEQLVQITESEKRLAIEPLFEKARPYVGYQLLAALANFRPVIVVNLNWDECVLEACKAIGVPYKPQDLAEPVDEIRASLETLLAEGRGVLDIHVHGRLGTAEQPPRHELRFAVLETAKLKEDQVELLRQCFDHATVISGASLSERRELDTVDLIKALHGSRTRETDAMAIKAIWVSFREDGELALDRTIHAALQARNSIDNILEGPDVEFDRLLWALRAVDAKYPWEEIRGNHKDIDLAPEEELILPDPALLREQLLNPSPVIVLPGRGRQGKSTIAHMLAHWVSLSRPDGPKVKTYRDEGAVDAMGAIDPGDVFVIDDPFGETEYLASPQVFDSLLNHQPGLGQLIVASRFEFYGKACAEAGGASLPALPSSPEAWWPGKILQLYAARYGDTIRQRVAADPQLFNTPFRVRQALTSEDDLIESNGEAAQVAKWLLEELEKREPFALLVLLVRLQDYFEPFPSEELAAAAQCHDDQPSRLGGMLRTIEVDGHSYLRVSHPEDVAAVDIVIGEHLSTVEEALESVAPRLGWVPEALATWEAVQGPMGLEPDQLDPQILSEWTFELVRRAVTQSTACALATLERAFEVAPDSWAFREMVFATVNVWRRIEDEPQAAVLLERIVAERERRGAYALIESLLRIHSDAPVELTAEAVRAIVRLCRATTLDRDQLVLIFDAMLWRELAVSAENLSQLFRQLLNAARRSEELRAGFAAAAAYHAPGLEPLRDAGLESPLQWTAAATRHPEVVCWHLQWHVAHQARMHAIVTRQSFVSADADEIRYLRRGDREPGEELEEDQAKALRALIGELRRSPQHSGWAVHLAVNVNQVAGEFDTTELVGVVQNASEPDLGLTTSGLYNTRAPLSDALKRYINTRGRTQFLEVLGRGFEFEGVRIEPSRFRLTADGWDLRERRLISNRTLLNSLGIAESTPEAFLAALSDNAEEALREMDADPEGLATVLTRAARGDTLVLEAIAARPVDSDESREDGSWIATVLAVASRIVDDDGGD
jgi:hypothetical protein